MKLHYRTITKYEERPPKWRIISESPPPGRDRYLDETDRLSQYAQAELPYVPQNDLVSEVFGQQFLEHEIRGRHLARLLYDRHRLTQQQLHDLDDQLYELKSRRPLRLTGPGAPYVPPVTDLDKQIFNLERQKRTLEVSHWRDTQELRTALVERRMEQRGMQRRLAYFGGGYNVGN